MVPEAVKQTVQDGYRRLGNNLANFVPRKEQNYLVAEMVKVLCGSYDPARRLLVAEAGTGIGKSLAYLQAAIPCARAQNKKLVISTATLSLQEQLIHKDLPFFAQFSPHVFTFTLVKGRQRYCCLHRLEQLAADQPEDKQLGFSELLAFRPDTEDRRCYQSLWEAYREGKWPGDRDSWPQPIPDKTWDAIAADRINCNRIFSHHHQCPFHLARKALDETDVLVVNHALLLADLALGGGVILPEPENCIYVFDEAHHLPAIARDQGAAFTSVRQFRLWLEKLPGMVDRVSKQLPAADLSQANSRLHDVVRDMGQELKALESWLDQQRDWFLESSSHRFAGGGLPESLLTTATNMGHAAQNAIKALDRHQTAITQGLKDGQLRQRSAEPLLVELSSALQRLELTRQLWSLLQQDGSQYPIAKWVENCPDERDHQLHASPLEVGGWLNQRLWSRCAGALLVSATLTAMNSFDYFRRQAGLQADDGTRYLRLQSPFDYQRAELYIPHMPCEPADPAFTQALIARLPSLLEGQMASLVLFSSYRQMQAVATALREQAGLSLLVQGEASREALLTLHRQRCDHQQPSILFGTGSFSEGLDLPGHYLTNLIITKLPFAVPTSPIEAAMAEWISQRGGNPFLQITVPEASRKLIQACGRLLRKEMDGGRITLLDRRVLTKAYGKGLLASLPPFRRTIER